MGVKSVTPGETRSAERSDCGVACTPTTAAAQANRATRTSIGRRRAHHATDLPGRGSFTTLAGEVGDYSIEGPILAGASATLTFNGPPGWNAYLTYSFEMAPTFVADRSGFSIVDPSSPTIFVGQIPPTGTLEVSMPFNLPANAEAAVVYTQAKLYEPVLGTPYLAAPSVLLVMREPCP